jgi:putative nucleotidyltransferase with HDIG domain
MDPHRLIFTEAVSNRFAQILYRCLEEVGSAKGALYLREASDGPFRWICGYGWPRGGSLPASLPPLDPLIILVSRERRCFAVNDSGEFPELSAFGQDAPRPRFFVTPLYDAGEWIGLLLQRDRLKGEGFDAARDERPTLSICGDLVGLYRESRDLGSPIQERAEPLPPAPEPESPMAPPPADQAPQPPPAPLPAEGLIPELGDDRVEGFRNSMRATGSFSVLPWEQEQLAIPSRTDAGKLRGEGIPLEERRPGRFLPEHRRYFWETAAVLLDLVSSDAAALWVEEADELRPALLYSHAPLSSSMKQQALGQLTFHLPGVEQKLLQLVSKPRVKDAPVLEGAFQAYTKALLWEEDGRRDLLLVFRAGNRPFSAQEADRVAQVGRLLEMHLQEARLHERYHRAFLSVSHRILKSGEGRNPTIRAHSLATAKLARNVALRLDLPSAEVEAVSIAAILHDVGTLMLDPQMLAKPELSAEELAKVRTHPVLAATFLKDFKFPFDVLRIIRHHHERWDGRGYPDGLAGDLIPIGSRIIGVIEAFEVMTSGKSYRSAMTLAQGLDELQREAGAQFDPAVVEALQKIVQKAK